MFKQDNSLELFFLKFAEVPNFLERNLTCTKSYNRFRRINVGIK